MKQTGFVNGELIESTSTAQILSDQDGLTLVRVGGALHEVFLNKSEASDGNSTGLISVEPETVRQRVIRERFSGSLGAGAGAQGGGSHAKVVKAPMPGMVKTVSIEVGTRVKKSTTVIILEAMKMENSIAAGVDGVVSKLMASAGVSIEKNAPICEITSDS
jgi:biotin carboxyl carrier protein